ncbi:MAG: rRNA pseudouridine synthase [Nanoarchaeota archaeon]|nr:MAG: rRNA pseudouridine synthase [Nanoarchaeota archaeon]
MNRKQRLLKIVVQSRIYTTRLEAERAVRAGKVLVDGKPLSNPQYQLDPNKRKVIIEGKSLKISTEKLYFAFNKPAGVTCEKNEVSNVYHFLKRLKIPEDSKKSLSCVGRLDKDTTGLLIFTSDGQFAHKVLGTSVKKTYEAVVEGYLSKEEAERIRKGIDIRLDDKIYKTQPAELFNIKGDENTTSAKIAITEGKKRQIRKMFEAVKHPVISLKRIQIGNLKLETLTQGNFRQITVEEVLGKQNKKKSRDDYY